MDYKQTQEQNKEAKKKHAWKHWELLQSKHFSKYHNRCLKTLLCHTVSYGRVKNRVVLGEKQMQKSLLSSVQVNSGWLCYLGSCDNEDWSFFVFVLLHMQIVHLWIKKGNCLLWPDLHHLDFGYQWLSPVHWANV